MKYKNLEIHNAAELVQNEDGSCSWIRAPKYVADALETDLAKRLIRNTVGVELRFVLKGDSVRIKMSTVAGDAPFHICRGGVQGTSSDYETHKIIRQEPEWFEITGLEKMDWLKRMHDQLELPWDSEVIRIVFDRGSVKIHEIEGDIAAPTPEQTPEKTLLCYGSSITHGSNSMDKAHSWTSILAERLRMDYRNLGMAGNCKMEPEFAEYIASEGEKGEWDIAVLELGINVLSWPDELIDERAGNFIRQVAGRNPDKHVFVVSPFYHCGDEFADHGNGYRWRSRLKELTAALAFPNVTYVNGLDVLDGMQYMSADFIHPNIHGVQRIADRLTEIICAVIHE